MNRLSSSDSLNRLSSKRQSCRQTSRTSSRLVQTSVVDAILLGSTDALARALKSGADPNETDKDGVPAIFTTLEKSGRPDMLRLLLEHGSDPNARQPIVQRTCLHAASKLGYQLCVASLLSHGADASLVDFKGNTALMHAARNGHAAIVKIIAKHEAEFGQGRTSIADISNLSGESPLHAAVESGDLETVRLLTRGAVDPNCSDQTGRTPFLLACKLNNFNIAEALLNESYKEIQINAREIGSGRTSLFWAVLHCNARLVEFLLKHGAEVDVPDKDWQTPFLLAVKRGGDELIMKLLLDAGCNAAVTDRSFNTALHYAASEGIAESLPLLIKAGLDPNIKGACGLTALMLAAYRGHEDVVKLLLSFGAKADLQDRLHCSAIAYALVGETKKAVPFSGAKNNSCSDTVLMCLKALIRSNCNIDSGNGFKRLCSCYSIELNNCDVDQLEDERLYSPLEIAFLKCNVQAFKILVQAGCDLRGFTLGSKEVLRCKDKVASSIMMAFITAKNKQIPSLRSLCRRPALTNLMMQSVSFNNISELQVSEDIKKLLCFQDLDATIEVKINESYMNKINHHSSLIKTTGDKVINYEPLSNASSYVPSLTSDYNNDKSHATSLHYGKIASRQSNNDSNIDSFKRSCSMRPTKLPSTRNASNPRYSQPLQQENKTSISRSNSVRALKQSPAQAVNYGWGSDRQSVSRARTTSFGSEDSERIKKHCTAKISMHCKHQSNSNISDPNDNSPDKETLKKQCFSKIGIHSKHRSNSNIIDSYDNSPDKLKNLQITNSANTQIQQNINNEEISYEQNVSLLKTTNYNKTNINDCFSKYKLNRSSFLIKSSHSSNEKPSFETNTESNNNDIDKLIERYRNRFKSEDTSSIYENEVDSRLNMRNGSNTDSLVNITSSAVNFSSSTQEDIDYSLSKDVFDELKKRSYTWTKVNDTNRYKHNFNNNLKNDENANIELVTPKEILNYNESKKSNFDNYVSGLYNRYEMIAKSNDKESNLVNKNSTNDLDAQIINTQLTGFNNKNIGSAESFISPATRSLKKSTVVISSVLPSVVPSVEPIIPSEDKSLIFKSVNSRVINSKDSEKNINLKLKNSYSKSEQIRINENKISPHNHVHLTQSLSAEKPSKSNFVRSVSTPENRRFASLRVPKSKLDFEEESSTEKKSNFKSRLKAIKESVQLTKPKVRQPIMQNFILR